MVIMLTPERSPPKTVGEPELPLPVKAAAFSATIEYLVRHGMPLEYPTRKDHEAASALLMSFASQPEEATKVATLSRMSKMTPPALRHIHAMLNNFGHEVIDDAIQLRHYITNKLMEESENPDPKVRMRALELLGKISEVGLFAERQEVTVTHQTTDDLREALRSKLTKLADQSDVVDAEVVEFPRKVIEERVTVDSDDSDDSDDPDPVTPTPEELPEKTREINILDALDEFD